MRRLSRRDAMHMICGLPLALAGAALCSGCGPKVIEVERIVEREVTKVVRETVLVQRSPEIIEKTIQVEKVVTVTPAPPSTAVLLAHGMTYGWTQFAMQMVPAFEEMFPHITVEWARRSDWSEYPQKIAALSASGELGDLIECPPGVLLRAWAEQDLVRGLDTLVSADTFETSGIFDSALDTCRYHNELYGLPFISHPADALLLYRREAFDRAGIEHPRQDWSLEDLSAAAQVLTADSDGDGLSERFGYVLRYWGVEVLPMLHLFGAQFFSEDGVECVVDRQEAVDCLAWAYEQIHEHHSAPAPDEVMQGPLTLFSNGRAAMVRHTLRGFRDLLRLEGEAAIGALLFPQHPESGKRGTLSSGMAYCISRHSALAEQALQWIKFMSSREMGAQMFLGGYSYPGSRFASWTDARVLEVLPLCAQLADIMSEAEHPHLPWNLRLGECLEAWKRQIRPLLCGDAAPDQVATSIVAAVSEILALPKPDLFCSSLVT